MRILAHLLASVPLTLLYFYVVIAGSVFLGLGKWSALAHSLSFVNTFGLLWSWVVYWVIFGVIQTFQYYEHYRASELRLERMERSFSQARLNALRMQLDPHFLFNALNTISSQIERHPRLARTMIEHLGDLLRLSLDARDKQEIPLTEELAFLDHYIAIQNIRFAENLHIEIQVAPEVKYALVPCLIVQPLVENAIRHGISRRASGGTVTVTAGRYANRVEIRVADDGVGLPLGWTIETSSGMGLLVSASASWISILAVIAACSFGHAAEAEQRWRSRCRYDSQKREPMTQPAEPIRVLVVDDEAPARQRLIDMLKKDPDVGSVLEAASGKAAVEIIEREALDLVFLDVQMPELDGLQVVGTVGPAAMPLTVFVTAYDKHAIRAFEANALDYLLKPFSDERWKAALARAKTRHDQLSLRGFGRGVLRVLAIRSEAVRYLDRLVVKGKGTTRFIRVDDIDWIEGAGVYVNLHVAGKELLYRPALNELAGHLDPMRFIRVHRSSIVNIDSIFELQPISHGEFELVLKNGRRLRVSRTHRAHLEKRLGQSL